MRFGWGVTAAVVAAAINWRNLVERVRQRSRAAYRDVQLVTVAEDGKVEFIIFGRGLSDDAARTLVVAL